jgi:shikimate kinase
MSTNPAPVRNIALIGFMGSGKTTVGQLLAARLGWTFTDTDALIVAEAGTDIPTLFATEGEASFRDREARAVHAACAGTEQVIATGGGAILRPENVTALRENAFVVWLTARPNVVVARTEAGASGRPVLARGGSDLLTHVLTLLGERGPRYQAAAHRIVDTSDRTPEDVADEIGRKWRKYAALSPRKEGRGEGHA